MYNLDEFQFQNIFMDNSVGCWSLLTNTDLIIQGLFKKRLNFLNSAPTSKENAMRLLNAPSVKF
jgi:hypothetical protein